MFLNNLDDFLDQYSHPLANKHFWVTSIWKPLSIILVYIVLVLKIGPWYMKDRKPYNMKNWIIAYDVLQILANLYFVIQSSKYYPVVKGTVFCMGPDYTGSEVSRIVVYVGYLYYLLKIADTIDTVFFILKSNHRQVSYLHVYHHAMMILAAWIGVKFAGGGHAGYVLMPNVVVHAVMYSYYLLSAYDPKYKDNLTIKKHVTQLQMAQFIFVIVMYVPALRPSCNFPKILSVLAIIQAVYMLYLFGNFYFNTYIKMKKDPLANDYFWMTSIWKPLSLIFVYVVLVKKIGPWYMENRKPYNVKNWIITYDVLQILANFYFVIQSIKYYPFMKGTVFCLETDYTGSEISKIVVYVGNLYFLLKIADIIDTMFFILKKNHRQVSYLHVYHHAVMILCGWAGVKFVGGAHGAYILVPNAVVHTVMYSYYLLSAYDPKYKDNLTIKKYVTQLQMAQFLFIIVMFSPAMRPSCNFPNILLFAAITQAAYMIYLFGNFYFHNYIRRNNDKKQVQACFLEPRNH